MEEVERERYKPLPVQQWQHEQQQQQQQQHGVHEFSGPHRPLEMRMSKTDGNASFLRAARAGNLDKVLEYIKNNIDTNVSNTNGLTALHLASKEGHVHVVAELLRRDADIDIATKKGNTALHIASLAGQEDVIKILVQSGAKINVQSQNGFTPLYMAAQENHAEVVKYLLANGANQALSTEDGFTPLAVALQQGHDKVVAVLLENDLRSKVRLPALHIAAKKDDVKAATLLLQNDHNADITSKNGGLVNDTTKSGFTPLHIAAHYGNTSVGQLLIEKGADVNYKARNSISPLHVASKWGRANMVQLLLDSHALVDCRTRDGLTPLHCAARSGHDQVMDLLLERGAPVTAKTKNGLSPLHMSVQGDHVDCARILLYHHAAIDDVTIDYLTPLHVTAHCGNVRAAKLLLDRKCEVNARALNGFTPLHIACKKNRIKIVELLLKYGASVEATTESGLTPLHVAAFMGHMNVVLFLLQHGANPNSTTVRGETALHLAARANQTDILRVLLRNGAHVDAKAREQQTALHISARLGNVDNVALLLQHGAQPNATSKDMCTALHITAKEGHEDVAVVLLDHGANQTLLTKRGFTPLHIATKYGHLKVVRLLLAKGINPDVEGKNCLTALHVATHYNHVAIALFLLEKGASPHCATKNGYTALHIAAKKNQMDIVSTLVEHGARTSAESRNGFTPLHLAAQEGHSDMVALLLEHSADVNAHAKNGLTPMHLAAQEDGVPTAEILVQYHADIDPQTKAGYTPLHTACHFGQVNMIRFLLDHGAAVNAVTKMGYTPLHQAAQQGHVMAVNILLKYNASPNAVTANGLTALFIAQRLGYISVVEILRHITDVTVTPAATEDKYKVIAPETMQEAPMSDSEEEGGEETMIGDQSFQYLTMDDMKILKDDSVHPATDEQDVFGFEPTSERYSMSSSYGPGAIDDEMRYMRHGDELKDKSQEQSEQMIACTVAPQMMASGHTMDNTSTVDYYESSYSAVSSAPPVYDSSDYSVSRHPISLGFLVSFMVDARGGAMRGCRHSGVRIIVPPGKACMPTRVTCKLVKKEKLTHPPPLMEGEALASRILEIGPTSAKFLGPVLIEVPHFASLRGNEREITILRSDNGQTWREHSTVATEEAVQDALDGSFSDLESAEELYQKRITRILTTDFPHYFAVVTRVRQESNTVGPDGGMIASSVIPQVQAVFPEGALTKNIKVGLQAQPVPPNLVSRMLGNRVAVSPIVTIEPRRRKFHRPITLTMPLPRAAQKGMLNQYGGATGATGDAPTLRLLCSIMGGTSSAQWEDITGTTQLVFTNNCVSFTTTVSARFWLMDCQNVGEASKMATDLYREAILVPFMSKFVVFAKRQEPTEARLRVFSMTDDKVDKTLESQEHFSEIARSRDVEVLDGKPQYVELAGNLAPVSKSGDQPSVLFRAFRENRLPFIVRVRDATHDASGRLAFVPESRAARPTASDMVITPTCTLNITLPNYVPGVGVHLDEEEMAEMHKAYTRAGGRPGILQMPVSELWLTDVAERVGEDWPRLATALGLTEADVAHIGGTIDTGTQAHATINSWLCSGDRPATHNELQRALQCIGRDDIVAQCMLPPAAAAADNAPVRPVPSTTSRTSFDSSGFDALRDELGSSRASSVHQGLSLDASYDEQDMVKDSESVADDSGTEAGSVVEDGQRTPTAVEETIVKSESLQVEGMDDRLTSSDAEYELEEVWDGKQWHVTKKLVSKKPASSKDAEKLVGEQPVEESVVKQQTSTTHSMLPSSYAHSEDSRVHEVPADSGVQVYAKTVENEPVVEHSVKEYEDVQEDGTVVHHRVTKTTQKTTVVQQVFIQGDEGTVDAGMTVSGPTIREYTDVRFSSPEEVQSNVEESEEVLDDGTVVRRTVATTSQQHLVTERHMVSGKVDAFDSGELPSGRDSDVGLAPVNGKQSPPSYIPELMKLSGTESDNTKEPEMPSSRDLSSPTDVYSPDYPSDKDIWNDGQLDDDNDEAEPVSVSSHSEVAQLEDITGHHSSRVAEGGGHGTEADARSEETDIDEPLSPSAREIGFSFSKNTSSSLSALAQSPPECLSPSKELALKDELSPVTEVPSDIRKLKFNIGASPSDFILEENEYEDVQHSSAVKGSQEFFKPISESGESDELETVVERTKPTAAVTRETVGQSLKAAHLDIKDAGVLLGSHDAGDSSDEERDVDNGSGLDRLTLLSFDNIGYEDPVADSDIQAPDQASKQVLLAASEEERSDKHHHCHKVSISPDTDSEKLIDAEMVDIQSTLRTQFESGAASKLGFGESEQMQDTAYGDEKKYKSEVVVAEPHESIRGTYDAEVLDAIENRRSNNFTCVANPLDLFGFSHESNLAVDDTETGNVTDTLIVSAAPDDVMKTSTSSDASGEPMILAATYDLDLGAVSRVVATYDMSPDSVDKVFVIDKQSKVIQSSPDDEVFETEGRVKNASKTEDSSGVAESAQAAENLDFDTNEVPFELVKADDVDGYEAYLEVMQQNRAVADQELGALLDLRVCGSDVVGESSCCISVESSSYTADDVPQNVMSMSSTACVQPDLIQGMPRSVDVDILSDRSVHSTSVVQEDSMVGSEFMTIYHDEPASEDSKYMPASFGKGALESDNMYQVFQQDTSNSPVDDNILASSKGTYSGLYSAKQADGATDEDQLKCELAVDQAEDLDDDFLAESAEPELMVLSEDKEDEECNVQVNLLDSSDDCQAAAAGISDSWLGLDSQCLDRPLSPLPDNAYRIIDDTDDAYVARHVLHSSTVDLEAELDTSFKQVLVAEDDNLHSEQAAAIVSQVMSNVKVAADAEDGAFQNKLLQDVDIDEGFFQVEGILDLAPQDLRSGTYQEVDDVDEGVLQEDEQQLYDSEDIGCSSENYAPIQHHSQGHYFGSSEAESTVLDAGNVLDFDSDCVHQKASEFVNYLVREAQVETEDIANSSHKTAGKSMTDNTLTGLYRVDEASEEFNAEKSILDFGNTSHFMSSDLMSNEDNDLLFHDQMEPSKPEADFNGMLFEWNGADRTNLEDYGDSSSVDSFATVVPCHQEVLEDRMEDLASVSSSFHSDLHSSYLEDQPEPIVCLDVRDEEFLHEGETEDSSGSEHFEAMRDDLDSSVVEMVAGYESPDEDKYGILDDDFDHPMMMLATIREEDERSSISGKSGKTGSSSERVGTSDSDKQASSVDLHAEYPCRRMVGKSSDKDDVSVSSSLLEFESLEKEMQDRTSLDSLAKLGSQQSVAEKGSEASSSLLEFERIEKELQDRTSHGSLTKLGSLQSVAEKGSEKDNVSVSSSLAEFERLEGEIDMNEPASNISVHTTYGMVGSTTSLNAFLMDDSANWAEPVAHVSHLSNQSLAFDEQFESEARAVVSMLEAGALPVMDDHMSVNPEVESSAADAEMIPSATDEAGRDVDAGLPVYPEYQDIVQIIRKASEIAHENVEDETEWSYCQPAVHEPDIDSLNERDDDDINDEDALMTAVAQDPRRVEDVDNDSLLDDSDAQMNAGPYDLDQVVPYIHPGGMFPVDPVERSNEDVMGTSADSIEGIREEAALDRSSDSLELRSSLARNAEALMHQSVDSLSAEDAANRLRDSFDADSLHESSALGGSGSAVAGDQTSNDCRQSSGLLMASTESGAWSQSDSLLSNTETLKWSGSSHDDSMHTSLDSPNALNSTIAIKHDNCGRKAATVSDKTDDMLHDDEADLQASQPDSCYCHSPDSPSSSHLGFLSQKENLTEHLSATSVHMQEDSSDQEERTMRVVLRKQVHKKTVIRDGQEETLVTEDTRVEQDSDGPEELRDSVREVISRFMEVDADNGSGEAL